MNPTEWMILGILTLANIWLAWWLSIKDRRYHDIFRLISFECIILLVIFQYSVYLTGKVEEGEMIRKFGQEYASYMKETKMFFPYIL